MLCGIGDSVEYLLSIVSFVESANGAGNDTLTAVDTGGFSEGLFKRALDFGVETAVSYADSADTLLFVAGSYAAAAEDTLGVVSDDGNGRVVDLSLCFLRGVAEAVFVNTVFLAELLEFAGGGAYAGEALLVVSGKNELEVCLSYGSDFGSVCLNLHAFVYGIYAGSNKTSRALNFNET